MEIFREDFCSEILVLKKEICESLKRVLKSIIDDHIRAYSTKHLRNSPYIDDSI